MTVLELEQAIRDCIMDIYNATFKGKIKVKKYEPNGYLIHIAFQVENKPTSIYIESDDTHLLELVKSELKVMNLQFRHYATVSLQQSYDCEKPNTHCSCNDKG